MCAPPPCLPRRHGGAPARQPGPPFKALGAEGPLDAGREARPADRHDDARRPSVAVRHRLRSADMLAVAPHYAQLLPELFSFECWGGATFRRGSCASLKEDPGERLTRFARGSAQRSVPDACAPPMQSAPHYRTTWCATRTPGGGPRHGSSASSILQLVDKHARRLDAVIETGFV